MPEKFGPWWFVKVDGRIRCPTHDVRVDLTEVKTAMSDELAYDLDGLAVDVFSLDQAGTVVESLTGAHAMTDLAASCPMHICSGSCSFVPQA